MPETEAVRAVVDAFNRAWNAHDLDGALACCTEDCLFENTYPPPDGAVARGRAELRAAWAPIFANPASHFEYEEVFATPERAVVRWRYSWGEGHVRGIDLLEIRDGRIAAKRSYVKG